MDKSTEKKERAFDDWSDFNAKYRVQRDQMERNERRNRIESKKRAIKRSWR